MLRKKRLRRCARRRKSNYTNSFLLKYIKGFKVRSGPVGIYCHLNSISLFLLLPKEKGLSISRKTKIIYLLFRRAVQTVQPLVGVIYAKYILTKFY